MFNDHCIPFLNKLIQNYLTFLTKIPPPERYFKFLNNLSPFKKYEYT